MNAHLDLRQIRYFVAVVDEGSFSAAAKALNVSQPSLSMSVKRLEEQLDDQLLIRGSKGVALTSVGASFYPYACSAIREIEKAVEEVGIQRGLRSGEVTIGISAIFTSFIVPRAMNAFHEMYPRVHVAIDASTHTTEEVVRNLEQGIWDFALYQALASELPNSIKVEEVASNVSAIYASASHPLANKRKVSLHDFAQYEWIAGSWNMTAALLSKIFETEGIQAPRINMTSNSFELMKEVLAGSNQLCFLPTRLAHSEVSLGRLVKIEHSAILPRKGGIHALYSSRTVLTPAAKQLLLAFRQAAKEK